MSVRSWASAQCSTICARQASGRRLPSAATPGRSASHAVNRFTRKGPCMKPRPSDSSHLSVNYFFPSGQTNLVWSDEAARRTPRINRDNLLELARTAEQVGFDALFIADNSSGHQREAERAGHQSPAFHAPLLAMGIFAVTDHIGVITTFHTTHHNPPHAARMRATLDTFSVPRRGGDGAAGHRPGAAPLFGVEFIQPERNDARGAGVRRGGRAPG